MDENFGQSYIDECNDWRNRHKESVSVTHLTMTGYHAGTPLCGIFKPDAEELGHDFIHAMYAPLDNLDINFCLKCVEVWNSTE